MRTDSERGFTLVELVVCVALLVAAGAGALAVLPVLVRTAQGGIVRDAALDAGRNVLERTRAAAAYYPAALVGDSASRAGATADHRWALGVNASYVSAARILRPLCGAAAAGVDVPLAVASTYDAATDRLTVTVTYPRDPCAPRRTGRHRDTGSRARARTVRPANAADHRDRGPDEPVVLAQTLVLLTAIALFVATAVAGIAGAGRARTVETAESALVPAVETRSVRTSTRSPRPSPRRRRPPPAVHRRRRRSTRSTAAPRSRRSATSKRSTARR